jgi:hypothetical protein
MLATVYTFEVEPAGQRIERSVEQVEPATLAAREQVWVADLGATLINSSATFREYVTRGRRWVVELPSEHAQRAAQLVQLRLASPMRPPAGRTHDVDGLALFDTARQPRLL